MGEKYLFAIFSVILLSGCTSIELDGSPSGGDELIGISFSESLVIAQIKADERNAPNLLWATARENGVDESFRSERRPDEFPAKLWDDPDPKQDGRPLAWLFGFAGEDGSSDRMLISVTSDETTRWTNDPEQMEGFPWDVRPITPGDVQDTPAIWDLISMRPDVQECLAMPPNYYFTWSLVDWGSGPIWDVYLRVRIDNFTAFSTGHVAVRGTDVSGEGFMCPALSAQAVLYKLNFTDATSFEFRDELKMADHQIMYFSIRQETDVIAGPPLTLVLTDPEGDSQELVLSGRGRSGASWVNDTIRPGEWTLRVSGSTVPTGEVWIGWCADGVREGVHDDRCRFLYGEEEDKSREAFRLIEQDSSISIKKPDPVHLKL